MPNISISYRASPWLPALHTHPPTPPLPHSPHRVTPMINNTNAPF